MKRSIPALLLIVLFCMSALGGEKLRYKFEMGKTYRYEIQSESKTSGSMGGMDFVAETKFMMTAALTVTGMPDGNFELTAQLEKATARINLPMMGMRDSTMELKELLGKRVKLVITNLGKVVTLAAIDTFGRGPLSMLMGGSPAELFRRLMLALPEQEVAVNGSWKENLPDTIKMGSMKTVSKPNIEFRVVGEEIRGGMKCWKVAISGKTSIEGSGVVRGMDMTVDGTTKISGVTYFAPSNGMMVEYDAASDTEQTQTFVGEQSGAQSMTSAAKNSSKLIQ